jgi:type I restriction enzyme S subunit
LRTQAERFKSVSRGATIKGIPREVVASTALPLPPIKEQQKIAAVLDKADELRAKRRSSLATLGAVTEAIFIEMFGDPVSNPKGWPILRIRDVVNRFETGRSIATTEGDGPTAMYWVVKVSAITSGQFLPDESKPVPPGYEPPPAHLIRQGDLLFSRANTEQLVGASALVDVDPRSTLLSDKIWRFVWIESALVLPIYVWQFLQSPRIRLAIGALATGTSGSMKNISQAKLMTLDIPVPPLPLQREFENRFRAVRKVLRDCRSASIDLERLFGSLQQRSFQGS